ncbi:MULTISPECIES: Type 1 glutamine amidotransferase-like domain-containing protein [Corynebacterium]|nr:MULTISPECIES: Type 1 glutamine amidotransferase-like domain-containing protein [Corynebacterium]
MSCISAAKNAAPAELIAASLGALMHTGTMKLFLASYLHPQLREFLHGKILYIDDAAVGMEEVSFAQKEREEVASIASDFVSLTVANTTLEEFETQVKKADCVYVASGNAYRVLYELKKSGAFELLSEAVRGGLPYAGSSAGAVLAGPSVEPISVMDDPGAVPELHDRTALSLTPYVVVPHAQGTTGPYTISVISETVQKYGKDWNLVLLRDGQALLINDDCVELI